MKKKSMEWLRLAAFLREREQKLKRGAKLDFSLSQLPENIQDEEVRAFVQARKKEVKDAAGCRRLDIEATYQAILCDPGAEQEAVDSYGGDKARVDALYAHASSYSRALEAQAKEEETYRSSYSSSRGGRWWQAILVGFFLLLFGAGAWLYTSYRSMGRFLLDPVGANKGKAVFVIPKGARAEKVVDILSDKGLVRKAARARFNALLRYHKYWQRVFPSQLVRGHARIRFGRYKLSTNLTPLELLERLRQGPPRVSIRVTIPEGFNVWKIADRLAKKGICKRNAFLRLVRSGSFAVKLIGWDTPSLEGYLYPDTYRFDKNMPAEKVVRIMVRRFKQVFRKAFKDKAKELNMSYHQVVTLASIIEKETGQPQERPQISLVFHNRMRRNWKLETDPTVIYGLLPNFDGNLRSKDLHNPHPYNTYKHRGLPPGPIASPGIASIRAALFPAGRKCIIFFVARNDKTHVFSCTKKAHVCWVDVYQRKTKPRSACLRYTRRRR